MPDPLDLAIADPWGTLRIGVDGPLHPGGRAATEELLDRAGVTGGTRVVDVGCGAGESLGLACERGARVVGLDAAPETPWAVRGDMVHLPFADASVDVVLAECVLCLAPDRHQALGEVRRVLVPGGRFAFSDVVVDTPTTGLPDPVLEMLCLERAHSRAETIRSIEQAGFRVGDVRDHRDDVLAMRDELAAQIDYKPLLAAMGDPGTELLRGVERLETMVETGDVSYLSAIAHRTP